MAREINMRELQALVLEEVENVEKDLEKVKAKEVKPDGYADTLEKPIDWESKLGIKPTTSGKSMLEALKNKETKAEQLVRALRAQRKSLMEQMKKEAIVAENKKLRNEIKKMKIGK